MSTLITTMSQRYRGSRGSPVVSWQVRDTLKGQQPSRIDLTAACLVENLFGKYLEKGAILEKRGLPSDVDPDGPTTNANRYVLADITSFFTLLVGIYFPSVTGKAVGQQDDVGRCCLGVYLSP